MVVTGTIHSAGTAAATTKVCADIQCILIDDGLGGADKHKMYDYKWHDNVAHSPTKRIVRVETVAEVFKLGCLSNL